MEYLQRMVFGGEEDEAEEAEEETLEASALGRNVFADVFDQSLCYGKANGKPLRLLCLHGSGSNGDITALQMASLGLQRFVEVDVLHGAFRCHASDPRFRSLSSRPFFQWFGSGTVEDVRAALRRILKAIRLGGPYDGLYGFSQGAALVSALSVPGVAASLGAQRSWAFVVCGNGVRFDHNTLPLGAPPLPVDLPSLHLIGRRDPFRPSSEALARDFSDPLVISHAFAHELPVALRRDVHFAAKVHSFIRDQAQAL